MKLLLSRSLRRYGKDVAMQIAAVNPAYLDEASVPAEVHREGEGDSACSDRQRPEDGQQSPSIVKVKMVDGRIGKFFKENCLLDQALC